MAKKHIRVVIVGGGFGGLKLARSLAGTDNVSITLISDQLNFRYSPALYRTATGHRTKESSVSLKSLVEGIPNLRLVHARAEHIDRTTRIITTGGGTKVEYDYAVLALGVITSYFGIKGLEQYAFGIKSPEEVDRLRAHLHKKLVDSHTPEKNYVVVGGGPTGIELAAALCYFLSRMAKRHSVKSGKIHIELIEAAKRVLPSASARTSRLVAKRLRKLGVKVQTNCRVLKETEDSLLAGNTSIPTRTVVWTAGVTNNPFYAANANQFRFDERKKIIVDGYLRVDERTFVIGDNAATPYSGLALTAIHNAGYVAKYLKNIIHDKPIAHYRPFAPISAIPVGPRWAVVQWRGHVISGPIGSLIRIVADLIGYTDIMGVRRALGLWVKRYEYEDTCSVCKALTLSDIMND